MKKVYLITTVLLLSYFSYSQVLYDNMPEGISNYATNGCKWSGCNVTYYFQNTSSDINSTDAKNAIKWAFNLWANELGGALTFTEVTSSASANIIILWGSGDHGDGNPFDGTNGVLAHAFYPCGGGAGYPGDLHFDESETWTISTSSSGLQPIDLYTVAAHEIGHSLGFAHSSNSSALMYAYYSGSHRYLSSDDISGIKSIYPCSPVSTPTSISFPRMGSTCYYKVTCAAVSGAKTYSWTATGGYGSATTSTNVWLAEILQGTITATVKASNCCNTSGTSSRTVSLSRITGSCMYRLGAEEYEIESDSLIPEQTNFTIYPNPSSSGIINFANNYAIENTVIFRDLTGKIILVKTITA